MIYYATKYRSQQAEIMDDFMLQGDELQRLLTDLRKVNSLLGGVAITMNGIEKLVQDIPVDQEITILDIGCGDGEMLRECARFGNRTGRKFKLIGLDANDHILSIARDRSVDDSTISFQQCNVFSEEKNQIPQCDIALCTLFLHHFDDKEIVTLLQRILLRTKVGVVINDLHRSRFAFELFKVFSAIFLKTKTAKYDGLVSVASGFKKKEIKRLEKQLENVKTSLHWRWAFRYEWILKKIDEHNN